MTPASGPAGPGAVADDRATMRLSWLLKRPVADRGGESIGRLADIIVRLRGADYPLVTGLVAAVGGRQIFVPVDQVSGFGGDPLRLSSARLDLRRFERRDGEVLLSADVLGHRLIDVANARLVRAADLELARDGADWVLAGVDTRRGRRRLFGLMAPERPSAARTFPDWHDFESLIGHAGSALLRGPFARIRRLKPAQIADLLEDASKEEETEILGRVHADPELEADVFEELDEDQATRLLGARTDAEIAAVLSRMRADDAADAVAELPQQPPAAGAGPAAARAADQGADPDGLQPDQRGRPDGRGLRHRPTMATVGRRAGGGAQAATLQPEALTSVHAVDADGGLRGVARWSRCCRPTGRRPDRRLRHRPGPGRADTDVVDVAVLMTDYNLITIPVVDDERRLLGVITVDDVLEVTLPEDWRRREAAEPPDARYGEGR